MVLAMSFLKKLKYTLLFSTLKNNYFILIFLIILLFVIYHDFNIFLVIFFFVYLVYLIKKSLKLVIFMSVIIALIFIHFFIKINMQKHAFTKEFHESFKVIQSKKTTSSYQVIFKKGYVKVIGYSEEYLPSGSIYEIEGTMSKASKAHFEGGFDYNQYLTYQNIIGIIDIEKIVFQKKGFSIYQIHESLNLYFNRVLETSSSSIVKALTIGNKNDMDESLEQSISNIGISHLFVISGLHINIIALSIHFILQKLSIKENLIQIFTIGILSIYFCITGLSISVFRVILSYSLKFVDKLLHYQLSRVDIICINIIIVLLINPFYVFQYSFILSYITSGMIILVSHLLDSKSKYKFIIVPLKISFLSLFITLPIIIQIQPDINFLSIIYNIFYIPIITYFILPLAFVVAFIPYLEIVFHPIYLFFEEVTTFLANIHLLTFSFPKVNVLLVFIYYVILYFILRDIEIKRKFFLKLISLIFLICLWNNISFLNFYDEVYFLDLPKGEAILIKERFNKCNILIDTGEKGYNDIILFLKKQGIKRLDLIIITHSDSDHNGMLESILNTFTVKNIYYNPYDEVTKKVIPPNIFHQSLKANDYFEIANLQFQVLSPSKDYSNSNDNSLVLLAKVFGKKYLFTGDITRKVEEKLSLNPNDVDILKVAHHGSITSSSQSFLEKINFTKQQDEKIAICMNGYYNQFSFPHVQTTKNIQVKLYITSNSKTICIRRNQFLSKYHIINNW